MIDKILIANRGEIAERIIRTARNHGYRTVAVYSEADVDALHVQVADEAVCIGPDSVGTSYLAIEKIIAAAKLTRADAIHPGYGFLSENANFCRACESAGIIFIGPTAEAIELMGSKRLSKIAMQKADVPCIPGYQGAEQSNDVLIAKALELGFPLMVKASAGGGGRGMRLVVEETELTENIRAARSEAKSAFGNDELILERAVIEPRHIEIQILADTHGNVIYLGERDCSIQRRHQKVVEEAPSPFVDADLRMRMGAAAVNAARACQYRGAGTVEFLVDKERNFYFLEMNTRLQVEHPVTELITGIDLVAWQINVANGDPLPLTQEEVTLNGHAIEVRIYAEDPRQNFIPQTGKVLSWQVPARDGVRVDSGIQTNQVVSRYYDPMLAKIIAWGDNRDIARRRLDSALQDTVLLGLNNNKLFLNRIIRHPVFVEGKATTAFIEQYLNDDVSMSADALSSKTLALAGLLFYCANSTVSEQTAWHNPGGYGYHYRLCYADKIYDVLLATKGKVFEITALNNTVEIELVSHGNNILIYREQGIRKSAHYAYDIAPTGDRIYIDDGRGHFVFENHTLLPAAVFAGSGPSGEVRASMDGAVIGVMVNEGDIVEVGQTMVILESMKMEHSLRATTNGIVASIQTSVGSQVKAKELLLEIADFLPELNSVS